MTTMTAPTTPATRGGRAPHVVVVGAGLAGLTTALRLRRRGAEVTLVTKGVGGLQLSQGTVDVLGYDPQRVARPFDALPGWIESHPEHPYARIGVEAVREGVDLLCELAGPDLLVRPGDDNVSLPTAVGALRPTAAVPPSMINGEVRDGSRFVIIGVSQYKDFHPMLIAGNLARTTLPDGGHVEARAVMVDFEPREGEYDASGLTLARALDDPHTRRTFARGLKGFVNPGEIVGLPAVLGIDHHTDTIAEIAQILGAPVFEIASLPPCVPGMRLNEHLVRMVKQERVDFILGSKVIGGRARDGRLESVTLHTAGHERELHADAFVLAGGGFESGALRLDSHGHLHETILDLPVALPEGVGPDELIHGDYWGDPQPLFRCGLAVDDQMRVLDGDRPVHPNVHAVGGVLAGATRWKEKSGEGIALGSAVKAADAIMATLGVADAPQASERN